MPARKPPMVISYLRFSTPEQLKGDSQRRQLALSERYAAARGWTIDKNVSDLGIGAFRGANAAEGGLGRLLDLIREGRIPAGSVLLVESLDRLSRETIPVALELFLGIIRAGIRIVTLGGAQPVEYTTATLDTTSLILSIIELGRAHGESAWKSSRLAEAWEGKRQKIGEKILTRLIPAWLKVSDGRIVVDEPKAEIVRHIFRMALNGRGITAIAKKLNAEEANISRRVTHWQRSYVTKILHSRAVIGEFQPHKITYEIGADKKKRKRRQPIGEPVQGYFPAIVPPDDFYAVQTALKARQTHTGPSSNWTNLFKGMMHTTGGTMQVQNKGTARTYAPSAAINGVKGHQYIAFSVPAFEAAFFCMAVRFEGFTLEDTRAEDYARQLAAVEGKVDATAKRINKIHAALVDVDAGDHADPAALVPVLSKLNTERNALAKQRDELQQQLAAVKIGGPGEARDNLLTYGVAPTFTMPNERRQEIQRSIAQLISRIDCRLSRDGALTTCKATLTYTTGQKNHFTARVHRNRPHEVVITEPIITGRYLAANWNIVPTGIAAAPNAAPNATSHVAQEQAKQLWRDAVRPVEIAKKTEMSVSAVYRLCRGIERKKEWKPASRWDAHKKAPRKNKKRERTPELREYMREYMRRRRSVKV